MSSLHSHNYIEIPKEELQKYYWDCQLTLKDIASIYGCTIKCIGCKMEEYGIERRSMSDAKKGKSVKHSGQFKKGLIPWNKDKYGYSTTKKGMKMSKEHCQMMSDISSLKGKCIEDIHKPNCQCGVCKAKRGELVGKNHPQWKGGIAISQSKANAKRKQELNDNKLFENPFSDKIEIDWHHITNNDKVAIPRDIHHCYAGYKRQKHREMVVDIVKQIYMMED